MRLNFINFIVSIFLLSFLFSDDYSQMHSTIIFSLLFIFSILFLIKSNNEIRTVLLIAFNLRLLAAITSYYGIFYLEGAGKGGDAFYFMQEADNLLNIGFSELISNFSDYSSNFYSIIIAILFLIFGKADAIPISLNIVLGVLIVYRVYQTTKLLYDIQTARIASIVTATIPWLIILCATILREAIITYFIITSVYFFIKYKKQLITSDALYCVINIFFAVLFHGGLIFIAFFLVFLLIYDSLIFKGGTTTFKNILNSLASFILIIILGSVFISSIYLGNISIYKLRGLENRSALEMTEYLQNRSGYAKESSKKRYRDRLYLNSPSDYILSIPEVTIPYFFKPYLWDLLKWRYPLHYFHSILMIYLFFLLIQNFRFIVKNKILLTLFLLFLMNSVIFSYGTAQINASIRHNYKVLPIIICVLAPMIKKNIIFRKKYYFR